MIHVNDQSINDEAHVPFSGTGASGVGRYNSEDFLDEITEKSGSRSNTSPASSRSEQRV